MTNKTAHVFNFSPDENGGEALVLETRALDNGDGEFYLNQTLTLHSYGNSASINLSGINLTPDVLRNCANEMEKFINGQKR